MAITVADIGNAVSSISKSPLGLGLLLGGTTYLGSKLLYPALTETALRAYSMIPGLPERTPEELQQAQEELNSEGWKKWLPIGLGGTAFLAGMVPFLDFRKGGAPWAGMFTWDRPTIPDALQKEDTKPSTTVDPYNPVQQSAMIPNTDNMVKSGSLMFDPNLNDQVELDVQKLVPVNLMKQTVLEDPTMPLGVKGNMLNVINGAPTVSPNKTTVGRIFDSARDVITDNLTLGGVTSLAVRGVVGLYGGKIIANVLDTVTGLTPKQRTSIENAGMVTNAVAPLLMDFTKRF